MALTLLIKFWREITMALLAIVISFGSVILKNKNLQIQNLKQVMAQEHQNYLDAQVAANKAKTDSDAIKASTTKILADLQAHPPKGAEATRQWAIEAARQIQ
jgi:hypothetical protein